MRHWNVLMKRHKKYLTCTSAAMAPNTHTEQLGCNSSNRHITWLQNKNLSHSKYWMNENNCRIYSPYMIKVCDNELFWEKFIFTTSAWHSSSTWNAQWWKPLAADCTVLYKRVGGRAAWTVGILQLERHVCGRFWRAAPAVAVIARRLGKVLRRRAVAWGLRVASAGAVRLGGLIAAAAARVRCLVSFAVLVVVTRMLVVIVLLVWNSRRQPCQEL